MSSVLLGLHEDTNSNAAAIAPDGRILAAVAEERLTRTKYQAGFPARSIGWLERSGALGGTAPGAADADSGQPAFVRGLDRGLRLVAANPLHPLPRVLGEPMPTGARDFFAPVQTAHLLWHELLFRSAVVRRVVTRVSRTRLEAIFGRATELVGHHASHAASAYFTGPWGEATVVTCDNLGDGECASAWHGRDGRLEALWSVGAWHSPGQFYGEAASLLGIDPMNAGKVTGLAARGDPQAAMELLRARLSIRSDRRGFQGPPWRGRRAQADDVQQLRTYSREDLAAGAQQCLEDTLIPFVQEAVRTTGSGQVALAGGVFANVALNRRIAELPEVEGVWVHPAMSDQGIGVGAALLALARSLGRLEPRAMEHAFLGPSWTESACATAIEEAGLDAVRPADLPDAAAALLEDGQAVARFDGAMEYGPRALGNRSILVRPDDRTVNEWLNERLDRSEYMPFAPITMAKHARALYEGLEAAKACVPFMTIALPVREAAHASHGGVVHVDGTARPQVLRQRDNPGMYAILAAFHRRTGIPSLVNTSFNQHGEPIVCSPTEAIRTFQAARLDALVLGPFLLRRKGGP
jgi:carbamoyltransferase